MTGRTPPRRDVRGDAREGDELEGRIILLIRKRGLVAHLIRKRGLVAHLIRKLGLVPHLVRNGRQARHKQGLVLSAHRVDKFLKPRI